MSNFIKRFHYRQIGINFFYYHYRPFSVLKKYSVAKVDRRINKNRGACDQNEMMFGTADSGRDCVFVFSVEIG